MRVTTARSLALAGALLLAVRVSAQSWSADGTNLYTTSGRVGILNSAPSEALDVRGSLMLANGASPAYIRLSSAYTYIWFEPLGTTFGSAFLQAGTNNRFNGTGNYLGFHVPLGRQMLFDGDIVVQNGITGTSQWLLGLDGTSTFRITDQTNGTRMTIDASGNTTFNGNVTGTNIAAKYQDIAEWVPADEGLAAGSVVTIDRDRSNHVVLASHAYDTGVAGVISPKPGITLGQPGADRVLVATTGRVKVRVDATKTPVRPGDLLVASGEPGMAMVSEPLDFGGVKVHRPGTVIGKALEPLLSGKGEVLVLLSMQ